MASYIARLISFCIHRLAYLYNSIYLGITLYTYICVSISIPSYIDKLKEGSVAEVKFIARISKMGDKLIIVVPMDFHKEIKSLKGRQVRVKVDDEI